MSEATAASPIDAEKLNAFMGKVVSEWGALLGTIATDAALQEMVVAGGLSRFRRATQTPFNRVFEAKL